MGPGRDGAAEAGRAPSNGSEHTLLELPTPRYEPLDLSEVKLTPIDNRESLVQHERFARPIDPPPGFGDFIASLPRFLAVERLIALRDAIVAAHRAERPVVLAFGAHVIKVGLGPLLIDLLERGVITACATNGAGMIHDFEVSFVGRTSEDVRANVLDGSFGMAEETARAVQAATSRARRDGLGLGRAMGEEILTSGHPHASLSVQAAAARLGRPFSVHVAVGTDIVHQAPGVSGADLGEATYTDFRLIASVVADLEDGVWINAGSAVVLPEVFLKAVSIARNMGNPLDRVMTANLDMIQHYRPHANVLTRPMKTEGVAITGHHELLLPLLRFMVLDELGR